MLHIIQKLPKSCLPVHVKNGNATTVPELSIKQLLGLLHKAVPCARPRVYSSAHAAGAFTGTSIRLARHACSGVTSEYSYTTTGTAGFMGVAPALG